MIYKKVVLDCSKKIKKVQYWIFETQGRGYVLCIYVQDDFLQYVHFLYIYVMFAFHLHLIARDEGGSLKFCVTVNFSLVNRA